MSNRRKFIGQVAAAGVYAVAAHCIALPATAPSRSLRLLILGGTGMTGPYYVRAALARGHHVAVFSRGKTQAQLPETAERLIGDRDGQLGAISQRDWDAVLDVATFGPGWVRSLAQALGERIGHYTFISTVSVYAHPQASASTSEDSPVLSYQGAADPYVPVGHGGADYGALKALCEQEAGRQFPGRTLVLRPGYIGGPGDRRALTYWAIRADKGGEILASDDSSIPVQYIDVRDLAEWTIRLIEGRSSGTYNAVGPEAPMTLGALVQTAQETFAPRSPLTWVPASWLLKQREPETWGSLLFWSRGVGPIMHMSNERALAGGLTTRPLSATLRDTLDWFRRLPAQEQSPLITGFRRREDGAFVPVTTTWTRYLGREREALAAWHGRRREPK
jgi:2'-hydroxyisoflavone reductase